MLAASAWTVRLYPKHQLPATEPADLEIPHGEPTSVSVPTPISWKSWLSSPTRAKLSFSLHGMPDLPPLLFVTSGTPQKF